MTDSQWVQLYCGIARSLQAARVPDICLAFCHPPLLALHSGQLVCQAHTDEIQRCGREGVLKLPGPPRNFRLTKMDPKKGRVAFAWDEPRQLPDVGQYELFVFQDGKEDKAVQRVRFLCSAFFSAALSCLLYRQKSSCTRE